MVFEFKDGIKKLKTDLKLNDKVFKDIIIADYSLNFIEQFDNQTENLNIDKVYATFNEIFRLNDNKDEILEEFKKFSPESFMDAISNILDRLQKEGKS